MTLTKELLDVELFLFDMDGTVYIGDKEIAGSFDAIRALKKLGKRICFSRITAAKPRKITSKNFIKWGSISPATKFILRAK